MSTQDKAAAAEYGDYQTPMAFARSACAKLREVYALAPAVILEPTFGTGNFIESALDEFESVRAVYGVEINPDYYCAALRRLAARGHADADAPDNIAANPVSEKAGEAKITLHKADIFSFDFSAIKKRIPKHKSLLIIGNPPWVTNSQLSAMNSRNLPAKSNFKGYAGLEAVTGRSNFDISEPIILRLLSEFAEYECTLAMLCKTVVARNIMRDAAKHPFSISAADIHVFDAHEVFGVSCDTALFVVRMGGGNSTRRKSAAGLGAKNAAAAKQLSAVCDVFSYETGQKRGQFGWVGDSFLADTSASELAATLDGVCQYEWRQGIKHDCSKVMELTGGAARSVLRRFPPLPGLGR